MECFREFFFTNPKRINLKQYAPKHLSDKETLKKNQSIVKEQYAQMQKNFGVKYEVIDVPLNQENEKIADKEAYLKNCDELYEREGLKAN